MIPSSDIIAWRRQAPWKSDAQVEQDLILHWMLIKIYSDLFLKKSLTFRGGTALHKLFLQPASRYSEDIDLVQASAQPIGPILDKFREKFESHFGKPTLRQKRGSVTLIYRYQSEISPIIPMRVKLEINTREHFRVYPLKVKEVNMKSNWYQGQAGINTYSLEELLGTKLRALYQRKKGRDLFDLWLGINQGRANPKKVVFCFKKYMEAEGKRVLQKEFKNNLMLKMEDPNFLRDILPLLRSEVAYDANRAYELVAQEVLDYL